MRVLDDDDYDNMRRRMFEKLLWTEKPRIDKSPCILGLVSKEKKEETEEESNWNDRYSSDFM